MLNKEKYADELWKFVCEEDSFAITKDGELKNCIGLKCAECAFENIPSCNEARMKWLEQEYVSSVDWSKVRVDAPILVKQGENEEWVRRYFAKYENGSVYAWEGGATSWSVPNTNHLTDWKFAKLVKRGDKR